MSHNSFCRAREGGGEAKEEQTRRRIANVCLPGGPIWSSGPRDWCRHAALIPQGFEKSDQKENPPGLEREAPTRGREHTPPTATRLFAGSDQVVGRRSDTRGRIRWKKPAHRAQRIRRVISSRRARQRVDTPEVYQTRRVQVCAALSMVRFRPQFQQTRGIEWPDSTGKFSISASEAAWKGGRSSGAFLVTSAESRGFAAPPGQPLLCSTPGQVVIRWRDEEEGFIQGREYKTRAG